MKTIKRETEIDGTLYVLHLTPVTAYLHPYLVFKCSMYKYTYSMDCNVQMYHHPDQDYKE